LFELYTMLDHLVGLLERTLNSQVTGAKPVQVQFDVHPQRGGHHPRTGPEQAGASRYSAGRAAFALADHHGRGENGV
ncbi:hypothetical protein, partial [Stakelama sediminis]